MDHDSKITAAGYRAGALIDEAMNLLDTAGLTLAAAHLASALAALDAELMTMDAAKAVECLTSERLESISSTAV